MECIDWTRLFRLPYVVDSRYKEPTQPLVFEIRPENRLDVAKITPIGPDDQVAQALDVRVDHGPRPSENEVEALLTDEFLAVAKKWLKGHGCYPCLFEHEKVAPVGQRDQTLTSYVGDAVNQLFTKTQTTKEHIYALFYETVLTTLEPDKDTPDWLRKLWELVERFWAKTMAQAEARAEQIQVLALTTEQKKRQIVQGMKEWCDDPRLHTQDEAEALQFMHEHLLCALEDRVFVMTLNGRYDNIPLRGPSVPARIRELGLSDIIMTEVTSKNGELRPLSTRDLLKYYGTNVSALQAQIGDHGGWISHIETEKACLNVKTYARRHDLSPEYNAAVDEWLQLLGGADYEKLCKWIGLSLAFDKGQICALAIIGPAGCGKKMLVTGLGEAITTRRVVDASEVFGNFNSGLLESPFVNVDEGWPMGVQPADMFRRFTGGNTNTINRKFLATSTLVAPLRLILTANNNDIIMDLSGKRDLTRRDQEALEIRLFPIEVDEEARVWLRQKGGHEFTQGWIRGDGGQPSKWTLAKHFLYLYEKHKHESDPRFLVEGKLTDELSMNLRTQGNAVAPVLETLLVILEGIEKGKTYKGAVIEDGRFYVTNSEVLKQYRDTIGRTSRYELNSKRVSAAISAVNSRQTHSCVLESRREQGKQRWEEIDLGLLQRVSQRDGKSCALLNRMIDGAPISAMPSKDALPPVPKAVRA
jgi:hypothetical protein